MIDPDSVDMAPGSRKSAGATGPQGAGTMGAQPKPDPARKASEAASSIADDAKRRADDALSTGIDRGAENVKSVAGAVEDVSKRIREESPDSVAAQLSDYCVDAARRASEFAEGLRGRSLDDLASDVRGIARNNPAVFVAGSIAIGFALSRFLRASAAPRPSDSGSRATGGRSSGDQGYEGRSYEGQGYEGRSYDDPSVEDYGGAP